MVTPSRVCELKFDDINNETLFDGHTLTGV